MKFNLIFAIAGSILGHEILFFLRKCLKLNLCSLAPCILETIIGIIVVWKHHFSKSLFMFPNWKQIRNNIGNNIRNKLETILYPIFVSDIQSMFPNANDVSNVCFQYTDSLFAFLSEINV